MAFSFHGNTPIMPYVEKALAVYLGGYHNLKQISNIKRMLQLLNYDQLEPFPLTSPQQ